MRTVREKLDENPRAKRQTPKSGAGTMAEDGKVNRKPDRHFHFPLPPKTK